MGGDGACGYKPCHAAIDARAATPLVPPREGAAHWPASTLDATSLNTAIDAIIQLCRRDWRESSGYHQHSLAESAMYRLKMLTRNRLWARRTESQSAEVAVRVRMLNRMADLACPRFGRIA